MTREHPTPFLVLLAAAAVGLVVHALRWDFLSDDAFIILRYARNVLDGHGAVWNPVAFEGGERVEGYTSAGWLLVTTAAGALGLDLVAAARWLGLGCGLVVLGLTAATARRLAPSRLDESKDDRSTWIVAAAPMLVAGNAAVACWALGGLETLAFTAALVGSALAVVARASAVFTATSMSALVLLRPEGIAFAGLLVAISGLSARLERRGWRRAVWVGLPVLAVKAAHVGWRLAYYGDWLPNTYYAKVGTSADQLARGVEYVLAFAHDFGGVAVWTLPLLGAIWRRDRGWWTVVALYVAVVGVVVAVGGDGLPMYRFLVPAVPFWALLTAAALADAARALVSRPESATARKLVSWTIPVVAVLLAVVGTTPDPESRAVELYVGHRDHGLPKWRAVGRWLRANAPEGASVATVPVGAIAYESGLPVVDMLGLNDRHIARVEVPLGAGWAGHEKHDGAYVLDREPTYLLLGNVFVATRPIPLDHPLFGRSTHPEVDARERDVFEDPRFRRHYEPAVAQLDDGRYLHYFRRRDGAL